MQTVLRQQAQNVDAVLLGGLRLGVLPIPIDGHAQMLVALVETLILQVGAAESGVGLDQQVRAVAVDLYKDFGDGQLSDAHLYQLLAVDSLGDLVLALEFLGWLVRMSPTEVLAELERVCEVSGVVLVVFLLVVLVLSYSLFLLFGSCCGRGSFRRSYRFLQIELWPG